MHRLLNDLRQTPGVLTAFGFGETHHVTVDPSVLTQESLKNSLAALGHTEIEVTAIRPTIEDCFMDLQS